MPPKSEAEFPVVFENLEKIARYQFTLQLTNPAPNALFGDRVEVRLKRKDASGNWMDAIADAGSNAPTYYEGDFIGVEVTNNYAIPIYAHLFDFGLTRRIAQLYPRGGMAQAIAPEGTLQSGYERVMGSVSASRKTFLLMSILPRRPLPEASRPSSSLSRRSRPTSTCWSREPFAERVVAPSASRGLKRLIETARGAKSRVMLSM